MLTPLHCVWFVLLTKVCPVQDPLDEDHADQVAEEEQEEDELRQKLQQYSTPLPLTYFVSQTNI